MKKIFISRQLISDSPLQQLNNKYEVIDESLIEFQEIPISSSIEENWIFFYSKNGVKYFSLATANKHFDISNHRIACMGEGTADIFKKLFHKSSDFIGNGSPNEVSDQFLQLLEPTESVSFVSATKSNHSVEKRIRNKIKTRSIAVYSNKIKSVINVPKCQIGFFTSPLNVQAYASQYNLNDLELIVTIGKTTAKKVHSLGVNEAVIATDPSETGLLRAFEIVTIEN